MISPEFVYYSLGGVAGQIRDLKSAKEVLGERFSQEYEKYYLVDLFKRKGFARKKCTNCGRHFWTLKPERSLRRLDLLALHVHRRPAHQEEARLHPAWDVVEGFFVKNGHTSVPRYPVVSRWRPDLFFTVASIVDFQRIEAGKVVFELPYNPLVVPQMCLGSTTSPAWG